MTDRSDAARFDRLRAILADLAAPGGFERVDPCLAASIRSAVACDSTKRRKP